MLYFDVENVFSCEAIIGSFLNQSSRHKECECF